MTLVCVLVIFTDLSASTFTSDDGMASYSGLFIVLAIVFGLSLNKLKLSSFWALLLFVSLVFLAVALGQLFLLDRSIIPAFLFGDDAKTWTMLLLIYSFAA